MKTTNQHYQRTADLDGPQQKVPSNGSWSSPRLTQNHIADYKPFGFVDGPGVRCSLYVSGCPLQCIGCYNSAAQSFRYGSPYTAELEKRILKDLSQPYVAGLSILGGEPFLNTKTCLSIASRVRQELPQKTIWVWSGYTWEQLMHSATQNNPDQRELLELCDVLVDGPFIQSKFSSQVAFRGSTNQRIIDLRASLKLAGPVVLHPLSDS